MAKSARAHTWVCFKCGESVPLAYYTAVLGAGASPNLCRNCGGPVVMVGSTPRSTAATPKRRRRKSKDAMDRRVAGSYGSGKRG